MQKKIVQHIKKTPTPKISPEKREKTRLPAQEPKIQRPPRPEA